MRLHVSLKGHVRPFIRPSVLCYFRMTNMVLFEGKMSSNDIIFNNIKHNDEVVASDVPPAVFVRSKF